MAARQNQLEAVSALLKAGARVDAQDSQGNTPLHEAARNNHADVMQVCKGKLFGEPSACPCDRATDARSCFDVAEAT